MSRIVQCFLGADLRCGHEGLGMQAKKSGVDCRKLEPGEFVIFINNAKNKLKMYASGQVLAYLRLEGGRKLDMNVISAIPRAFMGTGKIDYEAALRQRIEKHFERH